MDYHFWLQIGIVWSIIYLEIAVGCHCVFLSESLHKVGELHLLYTMLTADNSDAEAVSLLIYRWGIILIRASDVNFLCL